MVKERIAIFGGSFNPIHNGHLDIISTLTNRMCFMGSYYSEIWVSVTPQNPLKPESGNFWDRFKMVKDALNDRFIGNATFKYVIPTFIQDCTNLIYMSNTLKTLKEVYPEYEFDLVIGADCLESFDKWYDYQYIIDNFDIVIIDRAGYTVEVPSYFNKKRITHLKLNNTISSTQVRNLIKENNPEWEKLVVSSTVKTIKDKKLYGYSNENR